MCTFYFAAKEHSEVHVRDNKKIVVLASGSPNITLISASIEAIKMCKAVLKMSVQMHKKHFGVNGSGRRCLDIVKFSK